MTDHHMCKFCFRSICLLYSTADASVSHNNDRIRNRHNLTHLVRDKYYRIAFLNIAADKLHQRIDLLRRKYSSRLIHDQDSGIEIKRLEDLNFLLSSYGKILYILSCRNLKSVLLCKRLDLFFFFLDILLLFLL